MDHAGGDELKKQKEKVEKLQKVGLFNTTS
jgi:hypothetical protein